MCIGRTAKEARFLFITLLCNECVCAAYIALFNYFADALPNLWPRSFGIFMMRARFLRDNILIYELTQPTSRFSNRIYKKKFAHFKTVTQN